MVASIVVLPHWHCGFAKGRTRVHMVSAEAHIVSAEAYGPTVRWRCPLGRRGVIRRPSRCCPFEAQRYPSCSGGKPYRVVPASVHPHKV